MFLILFVDMQGFIIYATILLYNNLNSYICLYKLNLVYCLYIPIIIKVYYQRKI